MKPRIVYCSYAPYQRNAWTPDAFFSASPTLLMPLLMYEFLRNRAHLGRDVGVGDGQTCRRCFATGRRDCQRRRDTSHSHRDVYGRRIGGRA